MPNRVSISFDISGIVQQCPKIWPPGSSIGGHPHHAYFPGFIWLTRQPTKIRLAESDTVDDTRVPSNELPLDCYVVASGLYNPQLQREYACGLVHP